MQLELLDRVTLKSGAHKDRSNGLCVMELVAWVADEPHSDTPQCACPVISAFLRSWNDALPTKEVENRRAFMCLDWFVRTWLPDWLEFCGDRYAVHVAALRALPEIADWDGLINATPILAAAKKEAAAACDAAWDAARAAVQQKLGPVTRSLQDSAAALVIRMCEVK